MEEQEMFDIVELQEKNGKAKIRINNADVKGLINYNIKRDTDMIDITITISVPAKKFKTFEN